MLEKIERGDVHYDFVEVMACPGGCVGGGGQPIHDGEELAFERGKNLYYLDKNADIRFSHENKDVLKMYEEYFRETKFSQSTYAASHRPHRKYGKIELIINSFIKLLKNLTERIRQEICLVRFFTLEFSGMIC